MLLLNFAVLIWAHFLNLSKLFCILNVHSKVLEAPHSSIIYKYYKELFHYSYCSWKHWLELCVVQPYLVPTKFDLIVWRNLVIIMLKLALLPAGHLCSAITKIPDTALSPESDCAKNISQLHHSSGCASTLFTEGETASKDKQAGHWKGFISRNG